MSSGDQARSSRRCTRRHVADGDPQMQQARDQLLPRFLSPVPQRDPRELHDPALSDPRPARQSRLPHGVPGEPVQRGAASRGGARGQAEVHGRHRRRDLPEEGGGATVHAAVDAVVGGDPQSGDPAGVAVAPAGHARPLEAGMRASGAAGARKGSTSTRDPFPEARRRPSASRNCRATTTPAT